MKINREHSVIWKLKIESRRSCVKVEQKGKDTW
jgi:hypothetical protein